MMLLLSLEKAVAWWKERWAGAALIVGSSSGYLVVLEMLFCRYHGSVSSEGDNDSVRSSALNRYGSMEAIECLK